MQAGLQQAYGGASTPPLFDGGVGDCTPPLPWSGPPALPPPPVPPPPPLVPPPPPVDGAVAPPLPPLPAVPPLEPPPDAEPPLDPPVLPDPLWPLDEFSSSVDVVSVSSLADMSGTAGGCVSAGALEFVLLSSPPEKRAATTITNSRKQPIATSRRRQ